MENAFNELAIKVTESANYINSEMLQVVTRTGRMNWDTVTSEPMGRKSLSNAEIRQMLVFLKIHAQVMVDRMGELRDMIEPDEPITCEPAALEV